MSLVLLPKETDRLKWEVAVHPDYKQVIQSDFIKVEGKWIFKVIFDRDAQQGQLLINTFTKFHIFEMESVMEILCESAFLKPSDQIEEVTLHIALQRPKKNQRVLINAGQLEEQMKKEKLVLNHNNYFNFDYNGIRLEIQPFIQEKSYGTIVNKTIVRFVKVPHQRIDIVDESKEDAFQLMKDDKFEVHNLEVGGLKNQLQVIERRILRTRQLKPAIMRKMGLKHCKGLLLYGPPGTGKTLIARQISRLFKVEPKIVNGPEILNEMVGQSEERIRQLFADAEREQEEKGLDSQLHCIIFDEIDALCKKRGTVSSSGVYDLIVNQLLTCIDGIKSLNNILVIGITNRKDLIDDAILRPGRLEVHIEVSLPDEKGRFEVLSIHTNQMKRNNMIDRKVDLAEIANRTQNYTGAELEGVVKSAQSHAIEDWNKNPEESRCLEKCKLSQEHFLKGIEQVLPQFGQDSRVLESIVPTELIRIQRYRQLRDHILKSIRNLGPGKHSLVIRGENGVGKTVLASICALKTGFTFTKILNADRFIGLGEHQIIAEIVHVFEDAEKCDSSCIILDDILRLMDYVPLGPRFNERILNLLLNCLKKNLADPNKKQIIIATIGPEEEFISLGLKKHFKYNFEMQPLTSEETTSVLHRLGFSRERSQQLGQVVKNATLRQLIDTTQIEGTQNVEKWLKSWSELTSISA